MKQRVLRDVDKRHSGSSTGEMALLYLGISKVANEVLYQKKARHPAGEGIFTRHFKCNEIDGGEHWAEGGQCWVCEKWSQQRFEFVDSELELLQQNLSRTSCLDEVVEKCLDPRYADMLE